MVSIIVFTTTEELEELTGIGCEELWQKGFNLDDWDFGICLDEPMHQQHTEIHHYNGGGGWFDGQGQYHVIEPGDFETVIVEAKDGLPYWEYNLFENWQGYCVGGTCTEYNGKYYYMWHHA